MRFLCRCLLQDLKEAGVVIGAWGGTPYPQIAALNDSQTLCLFNVSAADVLNSSTTGLSLSYFL